MDFTNDEPTQPDPLVIDHLNRGYLPKSGYWDYCTYDHLNLKNLWSDFADVSGIVSSGVCLLQVL